MKNMNKGTREPKSKTIQTMKIDTKHSKNKECKLFNEHSMGDNMRITVDDSPSELCIYYDNECKTSCKRRKLSSKYCSSL